MIDIYLDVHESIMRDCHRHVDREAKFKPINSILTVTQTYGALNVLSGVNE